MRSDCVFSRLDPETITCGVCGRPMTWRGGLDLKRNCGGPVVDAETLAVVRQLDAAIKAVPDPPKKRRKRKTLAAASPADLQKLKSRKGCGCGKKRLG